MSTTYWKISDNLFLANQTLPANPVASAPSKVHKIFVVDCSGSMSYELPKLRDHLKNNLALTVREGDLVSLIWFSGQNQCGAIVRGFDVKNLPDITVLHNAIDRWLKPVGMTSFIEPLALVNEIIQESKSKGYDTITLTFQSDGYHNTGPRQSIFDNADKIKEHLSGVCIVEHGWYADKKLLTDLATRLGGSVVFSENIGEYISTMDAQLSSTEVGSSKWREAVLENNALNSLVYNDKGVVYNAERVSASTTLTPHNPVVSIPTDVDNIYYFTTNCSSKPNEIKITPTVVKGTSKSKLPVAPLYRGLAVLAQRMLSDDVYSILEALGDVALLEKYQGLFGKQAYIDFIRTCDHAADDKKNRWAFGFDPSYKGKADRYTVLQLLNDLSADPNNLVMLNDPAFNYQRIGRKAVDVAPELTEEEKQSLAVLASSCKTADDLLKIQSKTAELLTSKQVAKFENTSRDEGCSISKLVFNTSRPNVNILVKQDGIVTIPDNQIKGCPSKVSSYIWRAYNIIKDGIVNQPILPCQLIKTTFDLLKEKGVLEANTYDPAATYNICLKGMPLINRKEIENVSATELFTLTYEMMVAKGHQKVYKWFGEQHLTLEKSAGFKEHYGEEVSKHLASLGITDGGFSPRKTLAEATDVYIAKNCEVKIAGLSSLPSVESVIEKLDKNKKITPRENLLVEAINECREFLASNIFKNSINPQHTIEVWLGEKRQHWIEQSRKYNVKIAQLLFGIVIGQKWPWPSIDTNSATFTVNGQEFTGTLELTEVEEKV